MIDERKRDWKIRKSQLATFVWLKGQHFLKVPFHHVLLILFCSLRLQTLYSLFWHETSFKEESRILDEEMHEKKKNNETLETAVAPKVWC